MLFRLNNRNTFEDTKYLLVLSIGNIYHVEENLESIRNSELF